MIELRVGQAIIVEIVWGVLVLYNVAMWRGVF